MRVAVIGGGLLGSCVALELLREGVAVDLYDKSERFLSRASAQNEGKIHLGYVYANDPSLKTARAMIAGALAFEPLMRRWIGSDLDSVPVSRPFHYAVHADSLLSPEAVQRHMGACRQIALELADGTTEVLTSELRDAPERLSASEQHELFGKGTVKAAFRTPEVSIDPEPLTRAVRDRLAGYDRLRSLLRTRVDEVGQKGRELVVRGVRADGSRSTEPYDQVVNASWEGRLAIDRSLGLAAPSRPWLYRVKHFVRVRLPGIGRLLPSTTIVLGPFGDVVAWGDDAYLSWYPAGLRGVSSELAPPPWPLELDAEECAAVRRDIVAGLARVVPAVGHLDDRSLCDSRVLGGVIFAWGQSGIHDPASELHERHAIGVRTHGSYHSVDTGKLTTAPLLAKRTADRVLAAA